MDRRPPIILYGGRWARADARPQVQERPSSANTFIRCQLDGTHLPIHSFRKMTFRPVGEPDIGPGCERIASLSAWTQDPQLTWRCAGVVDRRQALAGIRRLRLTGRRQTLPVRGGSIGAEARHRRAGRGSKRGLPCRPRTQSVRVCTAKDTGRERAFWRSRPCRCFSWGKNAGPIGARRDNTGHRSRPCKEQGDRPTGDNVLYHHPSLAHRPRPEQRGEHHATETGAPSLRRTASTACTRARAFKEASANSACGWESATMAPPELM